MNLSFSFTGQSAKHSQIGLTSLIDVVFILLLFFMLSSTFAPLKALDISPASSGADAVKPKEKAVVIQVIDDDNWRIDNLVYNHNETIPFLQQALENKAPVLVRAEATASVQHLVTALSHLEKLGINELNLGESKVSDDVR